jgi:hypothetical protein
VNRNRQFETTTALLEFVREKYFRGLWPGELVMIVTNLLKDEEIGRVHSGRYEEQLHTTWYIGILADSGPLAEIGSADKAFPDVTSALLIRVKDYLAYGHAAYRLKAAYDDDSTRIALQVSALFETPLAEPFKAPIGSFAMRRATDKALKALKRGEEEKFDGKASAIVVAIGSEAVEKLCEQEGKEATRLYFKARRKFGLSATPRTAEAMKTRDEFRLDILRKLKEVEEEWRGAPTRDLKRQHAETARGLINHACELGLDNQKLPDVAWGLGLYLRPAEYLTQLSLAVAVNLASTPAETEKK